MFSGTFYGKSSERVTDDQTQPSKSCARQNKHK